MIIHSNESEKVNYPEATVWVRASQNFITQSFFQELFRINVHLHMNFDDFLRVESLESKLISWCYCVTDNATESHFQY